MADLTSATVERMGVIGVLVTFGGMAIRWLLNERKELLAAISRANERERNVGEQRMNELLEHARLMAESSEIVRTALGEHTRAIEALERAVREERDPRSGIQ